jgi:hypothetical protein
VTTRRVLYSVATVLLVSVAVFSNTGGGSWTTTPVAKATSTIAPPALLTSGSIRPEGFLAQRVRSPQVNPPIFVGSWQDTDLSTSVRLYSARTGRVVKQLATFGESFTNNGLALSPDGGSVFVTLIGKSSLYIERISTSTRRRGFVAFGAQPAISPDGRYLAYGTGGHYQELAVRQLSSGKTTTFDLRSLIGNRANLLAGQIAWLGDGSQIALIPQFDLTPVGASASHPQVTKSASCSQTRSDQTCLIVVDLRSSKSPARMLLLSEPSPGIDQMSTCLSQPDAVALVMSLGDHSFVEKVTISSTGVHAVTLADLSPDLVMAMNPLADGVLYLVGHTAPALWVAELSGGRLVNAHLLIRNSMLAPIAW